MRARSCGASTYFHAQGLKVELSVPRLKGGAVDVSKIRVLVAEELTEVRKELRELIAAQEDMELVGEVVEGARVVEEAVALAPNVVLLDLAMQGSGLRALERITDLRPDVRIVVLAMHEEISLLRSVLAFSSLGFVVHKHDHKQLLSTIRRVHRGRAYVDVPTGGVQPSAGGGMAPDLLERFEVLSKREREVLVAVAYGYTNREIAERIGVSVKSIETYRYRVAEKLGFRSRADLVRFALETGLLRTGREIFPGDVL